MYIGFMERFLIEYFKKYRKFFFSNISNIKIRYIYM